MDKILVTGGTGRLGQVVVNKLLKLNKQVKILSSRTDAIVPAAAEMHKGSLMNVDELHEAVEGANTIIHCASNPANFQEVDVMGTKNLLNAIRKNKAARLIYISIVGINKSEYPYYKAKLEVEQMISASGSPFTILRTTQFHNFIEQLINTFSLKDGTTLKVPSGMHFQSIDISEVADRLVSRCDQSDDGLLADYGGPEVLNFETMVRIYAEISGLQVQIQPENIPGLRFDLFRSGVNLCPNENLGKISWTEFLKKKWEA